MPHGKIVRKQRSKDDGRLHSLRQVTGGASGMGPPLASKARSVTFELLCRERATANEHLRQEKRETDDLIIVKVKVAADAVPVAVTNDDRFSAG